MNLELISWEVLSSSTLHSYKRFPSCQGVWNETTKNLQLPSWRCFLFRWWHVSNNFWNVHPEKLGKMFTHYDEHIFFKWVGEKPPNEFFVSKKQKNPPKKGDSHKTEIFSTCRLNGRSVGVVGVDCIWLVQLVPVKSVKSPRPFAFGDLFFIEDVTKVYMKDPKYM